MCTVMLTSKCAITGLRVTMPREVSFSESGMDRNIGMWTGRNKRQQRSCARDITEDLTNKM